MARWRGSWRGSMMMVMVVVALKRFSGRSGRAWWWRCSVWRSGSWGGVVLRMEMEMDMIGMTIVLKIHVGGLCMVISGQGSKFLSFSVGSISAVLPHSNLTWLGRLWLLCPSETPPCLTSLHSVLLQGSPTQGLQPNNLIIIDWEMAHYGHRAYDLGMFIGDLCEKEFLDSSTSARSAIGGFVDGYGELGDELAFRTAIHAGAHFAHWSFRRPPDADLLATPERITEAMKLARDYVLRAWLRDREWFRGTTLAPLFGF